MSGVQRPQWEKVMAIEAKIKEAKMIRENLAKTIRDRLVRAEADRNLGDRIAALQHERNAMLDEIEADRQGMARALITSLACCDLAATMAERFSDEVRRVSRIDYAGNAYTQSVKEARTHTNNLLKKVLESERLWEGLVSAIDGPGDNSTSLRYAEISERFAREVQPIIEKYEAEMADRYTEQF